MKRKQGPTQGRSADRSTEGRTRTMVDTRRPSSPPSLPPRALCPAFAFTQLAVPRPVGAPLYSAEALFPDSDLCLLPSSSTGSDMTSLPIIGRLFAVDESGIILFSAAKCEKQIPRNRRCVSKRPNTDGLNRGSSRVASGGIGVAPRGGVHGAPILDECSHKICAKSRSEFFWEG